MDTLWPDLRLAIRALLATRGFTIVAVATLALGIGADTAVFSIINAVLLKPLPFADAAGLQTLSISNPARGTSGGPFSYAQFEQLRASQRSFQGLAAIASDQFNLTGVDRPEELAAARVSASFFDVLGVKPAIGRTFIADEDRRGGADVVVLSERLWRRLYGRDPAVPGRAVALGGIPFTIIGALAAELPPPYDGVDVWVTRVFDVSSLTAEQIRNGAGYLSAVGRLAPGVTPSAADAEMAAISHAYAVDHPAGTDADPNARLSLTALVDQTAGGTESSLFVLGAAVGLVLLVACANVANLLLVRASSRAHQWAIRAALGASRRRIVAAMCTESLVLAIAGGAAGVLFAVALVRAAAPALDGLPSGGGVAIDGVVLAFSLVLSIVTGLLFGLIPAWRVTRAGLFDALKTGIRGLTPARSRTAGALVVGEVALSLTLLLASALLMQSFVRLIRVPIGFEPERLLTMRLSLPANKYGTPVALNAFFERTLEGIRAIPGVESAAAALALPPTGYVFGPYLAEDQAFVAPGRRPVAQWSAVTPGYFETLRLPIVRGRAFTDRDTASVPRVTIVSESLATALWPNQNPIGKRLFVARTAEPSEVVGVAGDVRNNGLARPPGPAMYSPYAQRPWPTMRVVVRSAGPEPLLLAGAIRAAVQSIDPDQPVTQMQTMGRRLADSIAQTRLITTLLAGFAVVALVMSAVGLYGVIASSVARRTREIGVRMALGARPAAIWRGIIGEGLRLTLIGVGVGIIAAAAGTRLLRTLLFGVSALDGVTYVVVPLVFVGVALGACIVPAARALRVDPVIAIRSE